MQRWHKGALILHALQVLTVVNTAKHHLLFKDSGYLHEHSVFIIEYSIIRSYLTATLIYEVGTKTIQLHMTWRFQ